MCIVCMCICYMLLIKEEVLLVKIKNCFVHFMLTVHCRIAKVVLCGVAMAAKAVDFQEKQKEALGKVLFIYLL